MLVCTNECAWFISLFNLPYLPHPECVGLSSIPTGDWHCRYCQNMHQREKCVSTNANAIAAGRVAGVDPIEQIIKRSIRIVTTTSTDVGGCALCRLALHLCVCLME